MDTEKLLEERGKTHGDFRDNANISQALKIILRQKSLDLTMVEREAIEMISLKLSRWVCAPSKEGKIEAISDVIGYAQLAYKSLSE